MMTEQYADQNTLAKLYPEHLKTIRARFDRALDAVNAEHAIIASGAPLGVFLDDYYYPFKPNPHFLSWLPLEDAPNCYIVHSRDSDPVLIYLQEQDYWHLPPADPDGFWSDEFDIRIVRHHSEIAQHLPLHRERCFLISDMRGEQNLFEIDTVNPHEALNILHYERSIKTDYELECMRAATRRALLGHQAAETAFRAGKSEFEIHLDYCRATEHNEATLPYGNIVALNEHAAVLHYQYQERQAPDQLLSLLIDAGASVHRYAADITRTYSTDDEFTAVIHRFDQLQQVLVSEVKAGVNFIDLHLRCHELIAEVLVELDLAKGSSAELIDQGVTSAFYPHGLGHLLGLQVHDMGGHMANQQGERIEPPKGHGALRLTRRLEENQVLTIEPGLYIIDMLLEELAQTGGGKYLNHSRIDWMRQFGGIRIEDNVRVLADGCENFTRES